MTRGKSTRAGAMVQQWWPPVLAGLLLVEWAANWWPGGTLRQLFGIGPSWMSDSGDYGGLARTMLHPLYPPYLLLVALAGVWLARRWLPVGGPVSLPWTAKAAFALYLLAHATHIAFLLGLRSDAWTLLLIPLLTIAALLFKVFGMLAVGAQLARPGAEPAWADTQPQGRAPARRRAWSKAMLIATALGLFPLFSAWDHFAGVLFVLSDHDGLALLGRPLTAVALAAWVLSVLHGRGVLRPQPAPGPARAACWVLAAYLLLAPVGMVLSAIPYGGGSVPPEVRVLLSIAQLLGLLGLMLALRRSFPAAAEARVQAAAG